MKIQIRHNIFETNSSSVHSLTMCDLAEWNDWQADLTYFNLSDQTFERQDVIDRIIEEKFSSYLIEEKITFKGENSEDKRDMKFNEFAYEWKRDNEYYSAEDFFDSFGDTFETFTEYHHTKSGEQVVAFGFFGRDG